MHSIRSLTINLANSFNNESILRSGNAQRRREISLHDSIVIVNQIGVVEEVIAQVCGVTHDSGNVTEEHGVQGRGSD